jgi:hypothetical protein
MIVCDVQAMGLFILTDIKELWLLGCQTSEKNPTAEF